jgi:hypothetical protein
VKDVVDYVEITLMYSNIKGNVMVLIQGMPATADNRVLEAYTERKATPFSSTRTVSAHCGQGKEGLMRNRDVLLSVFFRNLETCYSNTLLILRFLDEWLLAPLFFAFLGITISSDNRVLEGVT